MKIDWVNIPTYNTVMSLCAGTGLVLVVLLARHLLKGTPFSPAGFALALGSNGTILFIMGLVMSMTWPLARIAPFDNIFFGEPSVVFGALQMAAALYLWKRADDLFVVQDIDTVAASTPPARQVNLERARLTGMPLSVLTASIGLACLAIAAAGWRYTLFAAPPQEPISGWFGQWPWLEATFISGLYVLVGVGAVLCPMAVRKDSPALNRVIGWCWFAAGIVFILFGAFNYFSHTGLIINTMLGESLTGPVTLCADPIARRYAEPTDHRRWRPRFGSPSPLRGGAPCLLAPCIRDGQTPGSPPGDVVSWCPARAHAWSPVAGARPQPTASSTHLAATGGSST